MKCVIRSKNIQTLATLQSGDYFKIKNDHTIYQVGRFRGVDGYVTRTIYHIDISTGEFTTALDLNTEVIKLNPIGFNNDVFEFEEA